MSRLLLRVEIMVLCSYTCESSLMVAVFGGRFQDEVSVPGGSSTPFSRYMNTFQITKAVPNPSGWARSWTQAPLRERQTAVLEDR
jgi:hypothetical protein